MICPSFKLIEPYQNSQSVVKVHFNKIKIKC